MPKFRIGCHLGIFPKLSRAPTYANSIGCDMFQIFLGDPQQVINKVIPDEELIKLSKQLSKYKMKMVVHGSYTINLSNPLTNHKHVLSVKAIVKDLQMISIIGKRCIGLVIHMGRNVPANNIDSNQAIKNYVKGLKSSLKGSP